MQQKYVTWDRYVLILALFIFTIGSYSLFANTNSNDLLEVTTLQNQAKGTVTDSNGIPIPGVTIQIKGTSKGTFTNDNGEFNINASPTDILILTYIGFKTLEVSVGNSSELSLVLHEDVTNLDAVTVNAGYYTVKERERTGSIAKVTAEEIELQPIVSPLQSLEGRMTGVEIEQGSGITGLAPTIRIRGQNSLRNSNRDNGNYPLFIVDGIPLNSAPIQSIGSLTISAGIDPLSTLNLSNIESIEVLKDAGATAIYGSRGANGVILITTKKGKPNQDKSSLDINLHTGISEVSNKINLLNSQQYLSIRKQAIQNDELKPEDVYAPDLTLWNQERNTDWQDALFGEAASTMDFNLAVYGGSEQTAYRIGGSYHTQGSVFPGDFKYNKVTANINFNHRSLDNRFHLNFSANYGSSNNKLFNGTNLVYNALIMPPNAPAIYQVDGSLNWNDWVLDNPLAILEEPQEIKTNNLFANVSLSYTILQGLRFKVNLGYSKLYNEDQIRYFKERYNPRIRERLKLRTTQNQSNRESWIVEPQMVYHKSYGEYGFDVLAGATLQDSQNSLRHITGRGFADKNLMKNFSAAETVRIINDDHTDYRYAAIFGRLGMNWAGKYFLNFTSRRDGSSRFGPNRKFSNFWALAGAWIFSNERIIKDKLSFLSFGKLRSSYGTTGSDQIPDYGYLDTYEATKRPGGLYPTHLYNPNYSWEVNKKLEMALQLGFIKDRINLEVSWYRNRSANQLVGYPLPAITGFTSVQANLPAIVENNGWEMLVSTTNVNNRNFSWQTSINMTLPKNKLIEFDKIDQTSYANLYRVGQPLNISLLYEFDGIDPETGLYKVKDFNEDGKFNNDDRVVIENMGRRHYGGISNHFQYKGLILSFLFEYIKQNNRSQLFNTSAPGSFGNLPIGFQDSWEKAGDNENIQMLSQSFDSQIAFSRASLSSASIVDASFIRLKNVSISYQLPQIILQKINVNSGHIYVHAQNLLTITPYKGLDPQGGLLVVPPLRTITCGIQLTL